MGADKARSSAWLSNTVRLTLLALFVCLIVVVMGNLWPFALGGTITQAAAGGVVTCIGILVARATGIGSTTKLSYKPPGKSQVPKDPEGG